MRDRQTIAREAMAARLAEARLYIGSDAYAAFVHLLDAIDQCYGEELRHVIEPRLGEVRGASRQCRVLYECLIDRQGMSSPKI